MYTNSSNTNDVSICKLNPTLIAYQQCLKQTNKQKTATRQHIPLKISLHLLPSIINFKIESIIVVRALKWGLIRQYTWIYIVELAQFTRLVYTHKWTS